MNLYRPRPTQADWSWDSPSQLPETDKQSSVAQAAEAPECKQSFPSATDAPSKEENEEAYIGDEETTLTATNHRWTEQPEDEALQPEEAVAQEEVEGLSEGEGSQRVGSEEDASKSQSKKKRISPWEVLGEGFVMVPNFKSRILPSMLLLFIVAFVQIFLTKRSETTAREIDRVQRKTADFRNSNVFIQAEIKNLSHKLNVEEVILQQGLDLIPSETPPYILYPQSTQP